MVIAIGAVTLTEMNPVSYTDAQVTAEQDQPTAPFPSNYTLDASTKSEYVQVKENSVTVTYEDTSAGTNTTLTESTDYEIYLQDGKIELKNTTTTSSYDDANDYFYTDYEYEQESEATNILDSGQSALGTFGDFLTVIVVVGIAAVIFLLLNALKAAGGKTMA